MLNDLLFSLEIVVPLFALLILGAGLKRGGMIGDAFARNGNRMMFFVGLPVIVFRSIVGSDLRAIFDGRFVAAMLGLTVVSTVVIWAVSGWVIGERGVRGAFISSAFRGNQAFLGIPLMMNLAGDAGLLRATMVVTFVLPVANVLSVFVMVFNGDGSKKVTARGVVGMILKNPVILVTALGLTLVLSGARLPGVVDTTLTYVAEMATPLALVCIGASLTFHGFDAKFKLAVAATVVKIVALPLFFAGVGFLLGFRGVDLAAMAIMGGVPSAIAGYAMVVEMGGDGYVAGTIVALSTLLSAFTLTLIIYAVRVLGWV